MSSDFSIYEGKRVVLTGHTGFKGSWLALWLHHLGAHVAGIALDPHTEPNLFSEAGVGDRVDDYRCDIRDHAALHEVMKPLQPDMVFHLAAQPLVRKSYDRARETFETNTMGSVNVFDVVRNISDRTVLVHVGTDKVYENREDGSSYHEEDPLGGYDPYSASKAAAEIAFSSYTRSFFAQGSGPRAASGRAGNVVGGGDWAEDRIVPDCMKALNRGETIAVRNPGSTRPWQHVLEALSGYLTLGAELLSGNEKAVGAWNFGPREANVRTVENLVSALVGDWGGGTWEATPDPGAVHEAAFLSLSCEKAASILGWTPVWDFAETAKRTATWYKAYYRGESARERCLADIRAYMGKA